MHLLTMENITAGPRAKDIAISTMDHLAPLDLPTATSNMVSMEGGGETMVGSVLLLKLRVVERRRRQVEFDLLLYFDFFNYY